MSSDKLRQYGRRAEYVADLRGPGRPCRCSGTNFARTTRDVESTTDSVKLSGLPQPGRQPSMGQHRGWDRQLPALRCALRDYHADGRKCEPWLKRSRKWESVCDRRRKTTVSLVTNVVKLISLWPTLAQSQIFDGTTPTTDLTQSCCCCCCCTRTEQKRREDDDGSGNAWCTSRAIVVT